jgi:hypothetical protein
LQGLGAFQHILPVTPAAIETGEKKTKADTLNLPFKGWTETGDHLFATKDALESPNNVLEVDRIHVTKHSLVAPSRTNFEPYVSKASIEQFPVTARPFTGPIGVDNQRSLGPTER